MQSDEVCSDAPLLPALMAGKAAYSLVKQAAAKSKPQLPIQGLPFQYAPSLKNAMPRYEGPSFERPRNQEPAYSQRRERSEAGTITRSEVQRMIDRSIDGAMQTDTDDVIYRVGNDYYEKAAVRAVPKNMVTVGAGQAAPPTLKRKPRRARKPLGASAPVKVGSNARGALDSMFQGINGARKRTVACIDTDVLNLEISDRALQYAREYDFLIDTGSAMTVEPLLDRGVAGFKEFEAQMAGVPIRMYESADGRIFWDKDYAVIGRPDLCCVPKGGFYSMLGNSGKIALRDTGASHRLVSSTTLRELIEDGVPVGKLCDDFVVNGVPRTAVLFYGFKWAVADVAISIVPAKFRLWVDSVKLTHAVDQKVTNLSSGKFTTHLQLWRRGSLDAPSIDDRTPTLPCPHDNHVLGGVDSSDSENDMPLETEVGDATPIGARATELSQQIFNAAEARMYSQPMPDGFAHKVAVKFESAPDLSAVSFTYGATVKQFIGCGFVPTANGLLTLGSKGSSDFPFMAYTDRGGVLVADGIDPRVTSVVPSSVIASAGTTAIIGRLYPSSCYNADRTKLMLVTTLKDANGVDVRAPSAATAPMAGLALGAPWSATTNGTGRCRISVMLGVAGSTTENAFLNVTINYINAAGVLSSYTQSTPQIGDSAVRVMEATLNASVNAGGSALIDSVDLSLTAGATTAARCYLQHVNVLFQAGSDEVLKEFPFAFWDSNPVPNLTSYLASGFAGMQIQSCNLLVSNTTAPNYVTGDSNSFIVPGGDPGCTGVVPKILSALPGNCNRPFAAGSFMVAQQTALNTKIPITGSQLAAPVGVLGPSAWWVAEIANPPSATLMTARACFSGVFEVQTTNPTFGTVNTTMDNSLLANLVNVNANELNTENPKHRRAIRARTRRLLNLLRARGVMLTSRQLAALKL